MKRFAFLIIVALLLAPGCATSKNVLNKATFGMVDAAEEDPEAKAAKAEAKEKNKAEKQARKEAKREEKEQEPEVYVSEEKPRSWAGTLTFGLIGPKDPEKEAEKQARKEKKRARKAEKESEERERKEAKKQAKREEEQRRQAAKGEEEAADKEEEPSAEKRGWANKLTFGLIGGEENAEEREAEKAAEREREAAAKAEKREREEAEKAERQARKEAEEREKREQKEAERAAEEIERAEKKAREEAEAADADERDDEKRGWASRLTFGLIGGKEEGEAEAAPEVAAKTEPSEPEEAEDEILVEEAKPADEIEPAEEVEPEEEPESGEEVVVEQEKEVAAEEKEAEPKRTLVSRLTFGLVGGGEEAEAEAAPEELSPKEARKAEKKREKQLAKAAEESRKETISALPDAARKLAKMPFNTSVQDEEQWSGETVRVADRESYSENGYGITDIGDVRIAVEGMTFDGTWRTGRLVIDSSEEGDLSGSSGIGNRRFTYKYSDGVMQCTFGSISFRIADNLLSIDGVDVPLGQGRHLLIVSPAGEVLGNYPIE